MANPQPNAGSSFLVTLFLDMLVVVALLSASNVLRSSQALTLFGGVMCSMICCLSLICSSNFMSVLDPSATVGLPSVVVSVGIAATVASFIHPVSVTVSLISSIITVWYISRVSDAMYKSTISTSEGKKAITRRRR
mmetsp:Transcript_10960/g.33626  ORF Transcript_10960/g.33626 Transcript_10960/m.33626 type:complete len:136 (+) Transcript_10960:134-541(+)